MSDEVTVRLNLRLFAQSIPQWIPGRVVDGVPVADTSQLEQFIRWLAYVHHRTSPRRIAQACGFTEAPFYKLRTGAKVPDGRHIQKFSWEVARLLVRGLDLEEAAVRPLTEELMTLATLDVNSDGGEWHSFATRIQEAWKHKEQPL
jgi:hypothetical protein